MGHWIWIVGILIGAIQTWFWFDRSNLQKRLEKVEFEIDSRFSEINKKLDDLKDQITRNASIERPASACRSYLHDSLQEALSKIGDSIELAILRSNGKNRERQ